MKSLNRSLFERLTDYELKNNSLKSQWKYNFITSVLKEFLIIRGEEVNIHPNNGYFKYPVKNEGFLFFNQILFKTI